MLYLYVFNLHTKFYYFSLNKAEKIFFHYGIKIPMTSFIIDNLLERRTYFSVGILEIRVRKNVLLFHKLVSAKFVIIKGPSPFQGIQVDHPCLRR